jgi:HEAT repeat protein
VKAAVIWALMDIGDPRSIEPLIKTLRDQDANIRIVALRALKKMTGESFSRDPEAWLKWWNETKK